MPPSPLVGFVERSLCVAIRTAVPFFYAASLLAQLSPTLTKITPSSRTDLATNTVAVTLTGTGFTNGMTLGFDPPGVITAGSITQTGGVTATVTFTINTAAAVDTVNVWVQTANGPSAKLPFSTGVATSVCLEALQAGGCELRWELDATSVTGSSGQTGNSTTPNIMVKLDYQWHPPRNRPQKAAIGQGNSRKDHIAVHADIRTGYTQVVASTKVQQTSTSATAGTPTTCPGGSSSSTSTCNAAVPRQAYVAEAGAKVGWSTGVNGEGTFAELGLGARGSFEYLIPSDKIVQSGGLTYIDLSSANPQNAVGFYEATGHFRLSQIGHNRTLATAKTQNVSNLLVFEAGYQNNRGLQGLSTNSPANTRNRYVARFYVNPELPGTNHTQLAIGVEYSGGIDGGPHVVQLFFGTNVNPAKLLGKSGT
jgi:hypothetical protein